MRDRYSVRRLLLTLVLSQAMMIQALLLVWSSAQAGAMGGLSTICSGTMSPVRTAGGTDPGQRSAPHDCLSACLAGQMAAPADRMVLLARPMTYAQVLVARQSALPEIEREPAFSARAPPKLT